MNICAQRFPDFYENCIPEPNTGCWIWLKGVMNQGYGTVHFRRKSYLAHRVSFEIDRGEPIPPGVHICHRCDNPICVNPEHLFAGTQLENMRDCISKGRNHRLPVYRGSGHSGARLTEKDVLAIRGDSRPLRTIAKSYGISFNNISLIKQRKAWRHI